MFIDDPVSLKVADFKTKSISITPEFMFTRSMFETPDMGYQGGGALARGSFDA